MNILAEFNSIKLPAEGFRWRTREGQRLDPCNMDTRHLFNTISMIWNHVMPADAATHSYRAYSFGPTYTQAYLTAAIITMLPELLSRSLTNFQKDRLLFMYRYLNRHGVKLPQPQKELSHYGPL